jgi:glycerol kinase
MLPAVLPSSHVYGSCAPSSVLPGVPISGILGDQQSALFGQACFSPGDAKNTYGTGCFLLMNTGTSAAPHRPGSGLLTTIAYQLSGQRPVYALEGSVAVGGAAVSWLRDNLQIIGSAGAIEQLAASVPDTAGAVFVPAFNGLYAPHWRSDARGVLVGLSGAVTRAHLARATLEAVAHQSRELLAAMQAEAGGSSSADSASSSSSSSACGSGVLKVDGGMTANSLLMQFQADVTGRRCVRPVVAETTALGAAYAAGLAVGFWGSLEQLAGHWQHSQAWEPSMPSQQVQQHIEQWDRALARSLHWVQSPAGSAAAAAVEDPLLAHLPARAAAKQQKQLQRTSPQLLLRRLLRYGAAAAAGAALTALLLSRRARA